MRLPNRGRLPAIALALVSVAILVGPALLTPHPGVPEYHHAVHAVGADRCTGGDRVYQYADLSLRGKTAFEDALDAPDGESTLYGDPAPEFDYPRDAEVAAIRHYVEHRGECYRLVTRHDATGIGSFLELFAVGAGAVIGLLLLGTAYVSAATDRPRMAATPLALVAWVPAVVALPPVAPWVGPAGAVAAPVLTYLVLGRLGWTGSDRSDADESLDVAVVRGGIGLLAAGVVLLVASLLGGIALAAAVVFVTVALGWWYGREK